LRRRVWLKLLDTPNIPINPYIPETGRMFEELVSVRDREQVWKDVKRCEHINIERLKGEASKKKLYQVIIEFLAFNKDVRYIQGMESIAAVLFNEFIDNLPLVP